MSLKGKLAVNWDEFESSWNDYCITISIDQKLKSSDRQDDPTGQFVVAATLCSVMGTECRKILNNLPKITVEAR